MGLASLAATSEGFLSLVAVHMGSALLVAASEDFELASVAASAGFELASAAASVGFAFAFAAWVLILAQSRLGLAQGPLQLEQLPFPCLSCLFSSHTMF